MAPPRGIVPITPDGNCFFRAVSVVVTGSQEFHLRLRDLLVEFMSRSSTVAGYLRHQEVEKSSHLKNMQRPGVWATDAELFAAALFLETDIFTFVDGWRRFSCQGTQRAPVKYPAVYLINKMNHYEVVKSVLSSKGPMPHS